MSTYHFHLLAAAIEQTGAACLAKHKVGRLADKDHELSQLVSRLRTLAAMSLPVEGERLWAELLRSTANEKPFRQISRSYSRDIEEITWGPDHGDKSSDHSIEQSRAFLNWIDNTYVPRKRLAIYLDAGKAVLDGEWYESFDHQALLVLNYLNDRPHGRWISSSDLYDRVFKIGNLAPRNLPSR